MKLKLNFPSWLALLIENWPLLALPVLLLALNYSVWMSFSLSGDDLFSLSAASLSLAELVGRLGEFAGQYRHLTYHIFGWYRLMLPNFSLMLAVHGLWLVILSWQLYGLLSEKIRPLVRFLIITPLFLSPIFYYHTFTISSLANLLMAVITLEAMRLYYRGSRASWQLTVAIGVLVMLAFAVKETFIVPLSLYVFALLSYQWQERKFSWWRNWLIVGFSALFIFYLAARASWYQADRPSDYYFIFSFPQLMGALSHLVAWVVNYPKGWQYGVPLRTGWEPLISLASGLVLLAGSYFGLKQSFRKTLALVLTGLSSISLFLFLSALHLFYLDLVFLCLILLVGLAYQRLSREWPVLAKWLVVSWVAVNLVVFVSTRAVWLEYSFVGRANQAAQSFQAVLAPVDLSQAERLCILNHQRGAWPTENGILVRHLGYQDLKIFSLEDDTLPPACQEVGTILLKNDGFEYKLNLVE